MPRNGSGTYTPSVTFVTEAASPPIEISKLDTQMTDIATALTGSIAADGQTNPSADLPMNGHRHTNVAAATALTHYARVQELIDQDHVYYVDSGAADAYVITPDPNISAYEEGQRFVFRATNANTGASTLNVNSLGATAIQTPDGSALASGAIVAGGYYEVVYDANPATDRFVLMSPPSEIPDAMLSSNVATISGTNAFTGTNTFDGVNVTDFARLSQSNTFTGTVQTIQGGLPRLRLTENDTTDDEQVWQFQAQGGVFTFLLSSDDGNTTDDIFTVTRSAAAVSVVNFANGELQYGGDEVATVETAPTWASATNEGGQITFSTSAASGTPAAGDIWFQHEA